MGVKALRGLGKMFTVIEFDGSRHVDAHNFLSGLSECGCALSNEESKSLISHFDTDDDGTINYNEFLISLRGKPNQYRQGVIDASFE